MSPTNIPDTLNKAMNLRQSFRYWLCKCLHAGFKASPFRALNATKDDLHVITCVTCRRLFWVWSSKP